ncbi:MAG TPA: hypothetical protein VL856_13265 [Acidimicrobiia bacterium]|jgi:hypothetical protein|nr:hypothetical protein [Acidimicrobiia bacterium]
MNSSTIPSTRRRTVRSTLVVFVALSVLFGIISKARPASAAGNASFTNVTVTTTDTTATIAFDAKPYVGITVTVGTSLDPTISKVGEVILPVNGTNHYTATFAGLKPSTGYSFRLWSPYLYTYTDISLLVTKAPMFHNVMPTVLYDTASIDFDYLGSGPVTVTISKTFDFTTNYFQRKTLPAPSSGHHWHSYFTKLDAGTAFAFKLTAPGSFSYTDISSIVTKHRDVHLAYKYFYAIDDGDGWPYGCGDFAFTHVEQGMDFYSNYWMLMQVGVCVNSGSGVSLDQYPMGKRDFTNVKSSTFRTDFYAWDDDRKWGDPECFTDFVSNTCGQVAWGYKYLDISTPGTHSFSVHTYGIQNSIDAIASGDITVTYY